MTYAIRFAFPVAPGSVAPYARPILRSVSQSSGKLKPNLSENALLAFSSSNEIPKMTAFFLSYSDLRSRNPQPSAVQPGVSAFG